MRFGLFCSAQASGDDLPPETGQGFRDYLDFNVEAEELGFHSSFLVEHHFTGWNQVSATRFSHHGRFWRFEDIVVEPPPAQRPHPPFWMAAGSPPSIRKAAERGFNLMLDQYASPEQIGERIALYHSEREAHGRPFDPMGVVVARQLYVARDRADAEAALARQAKYTQRTVSVARSPARKGGSHVLAYADKSGGTEEHALYGTPEEICAKLATLNDAGVRYILLTVLGGKEQLRRFAQEVMPAFSATEDGGS